MKIFEVLQTAVLAPGAEIKPIPPGAKPSGDTPTSPTQATSAASSKPVPPSTSQPTGFNANVPQPQQTQNPQQPTTQTATPQPQQQPEVSGQTSDQIQDLQSQMQALMAKIGQIQGTQMKPGSQ
jgi:hypothetical protein